MRSGARVDGRVSGGELLINVVKGNCERCQEVGRSMLRNRPPRDNQYSQSCRRWHWWQRGLLLQALTEAEALTLQQQDVTAMHQPVEERRGHAFIAKHLRPVGKVEIRGQCDADALVAIRTVSSIMRGTLLLTANSTNSVQGAVWSQQ